METLQKALAHHLNGELQQAEALYRQVLNFEPRNPDALNLLGVIANQNGKNEEAVALIEKAISVNSAIPLYHNNAGNAYRALDRFEEAIACYRRALSLKPDYAEAYYNLGVAFEGYGKPDDAIISYRQAVSSEPDFYLAHFVLGNIYAKLWRMDEAVESYRCAINSRADFPEAWYNLGNALADLGRTEGARECYLKVLELRPGDGVRIKLAALPRIIVPSTEYIAAFRRQFENAIDGFYKTGVTLNDPLKDIGQTSFFLAYHGLNNRDLQVKVAKLYARACPSLVYTAPHCKKVRRAGKHGKIRIGFISDNFHNHTIGKHFRGVIANLSRELFNVYVFFGKKVSDEISQFIENNADTPVVLIPSLEMARTQIAACELDVLFYMDIGMDPFTYFLAFSRLAPVQCVTWGHPDTTGIPNLDYFISCEDFEKEGSESQYSEALLKMKNIPNYFYRPDAGELAGAVRIRGRLGLPDDKKLYVVPQSLIKFHPDFDPVLGDILRRDGKGLLVLFEDVQKSWSSLLMDRFFSSIPDVADRIIFLPRLSLNDFLSLIKSADAVLDTPYFCGGTTSLEIFSVGCPIVTWPTDRMAGRFTYAYYRKMGVMDLVADNGNQYVQLALRLANDEDWRRQISAKILREIDVFFDNMDSVREFEQLFHRFFDSVCEI